AGRILSLYCGPDFDMPAIEKPPASLQTVPVTNRFSLWRRLSLFVCFVVLHISKEDAKIIPAAVEHTIHIDIVVKNSVKSEVTAGHQETIVTLDIGNRGQGRANQTVLPQSADVL